MVGTLSCSQATRLGCQLVEFYIGQASRNLPEAVYDISEVVEVGVVPQDFGGEVLEVLLRITAAKPQAWCFVELLFAAQLITQVLFYCAAAAAAHFYCAAAAAAQ
ncbi:hypothetical protein BY996DRAFT_6413925 [Phakopsora pachyrhizi]|nr:hypothetical protein BY996DRAFT_6413925 [Phakopsora pachyrhizi]